MPYNIGLRDLREACRALTALGAVEPALGRDDRCLWAIFDLGPLSVGLYCDSYAYSVSLELENKDRVDAEVSIDALYVAAQGKKPFIYGAGDPAQLTKVLRMFNEWLGEDYASRILRNDAEAWDSLMADVRARDEEY